MRTTDSQELSELMAFYSVEPMREERADIRAAMLATLIATAHADGKRSFKASDFLPKYWDEPKRKLSDDEYIRMMARAKKKG